MQIKRWRWIRRLQMEIEYMAGVVEGSGKAYHLLDLWQTSSLERLDVEPALAPGGAVQ